MVKEAEKRHEATDESPGQLLAQKMLDANAEFQKALGALDKPLMDHYLEAQKSATEAWTEYARKVQEEYSKPGSTNEAFKAYSTKVREIQSAFQAKWTELAEQAAKKRASCYREYVGKVHTAWRELPVEQLTPAEAVAIGQSLLGVATMSQMYGAAK
jgi:hypothetical protein